MPVSGELAYIANDHAMRTEVFGAFQRLFAGHDPVVGPTLRALPGDNSTAGSITVGPSEVEGDVPAAGAAFARPRPWQDTYSSPAGRAL